jgi:thiol:disulfide interchange protein DsbC
MKAIAIVLAMFFVSIWSVSSQANEQSVKQIIEARMPGVNVQSVQKSPYFGLYEVRAGDDLFYTDDAVTYIFVGSIHDGKTFEDLTEARMRKLMAIPFSALPLDQAFTMVKGKGTRRLAYFADPNCSYCKRLEHVLTQVDDATIYVFLYPILSPDSLVKSQAIWCSADRAKAWQDWMLNGIVPKAKSDCATPIDRNLELGRKYKINATPTLVFENGLRSPGALPLAQLNHLLSEASAATKAAQKP